MRVAKLLDNGLLLVFTGAILTYWAVGLFLPGSLISGIASLVLLTFGGLTFSIYAAPAWNVLFHRQRDDLASGSHLNVLGTFLLSSGLVWSGVYGLTWVFLGMPLGWSGTLTSNFGRVMLGFGMILTFLAPQSTEKGIRMTAKMWVWSAIILAFVAGFFLATQLEVGDDFARWTQNISNGK